MQTEINDTRIPLLMGGQSWVWDTIDGIVPASTIYVPFGCPDWGETNGKRNSLCTFCSLPNAVIEFRNTFYRGAEIPKKEYGALFRATQKKTGNGYHTLMIFNAGSFFAMTPCTQEELINEITSYPEIRRVVIESRAELIDYRNVKRVTDILYPAKKQLTIRIGVETQNDHLRLKVLRKGHSRQQLKRACHIMRDCGVISGGYVLLNPAPNLDPLWAVQECQNTIDWVLGDLGMDEAYFSATCVGPGSELELVWRNSFFKPATLWMVLKILSQTHTYKKRVHLLRFKDEPPLLAVPSNHVPQGIPENLAGAQGCDLQFHRILNQYRETMDYSVLIPPPCDCKPSWF